MSKVVDPILFSTHFGISSLKLDNAGLIDPFINVDTRLFIDPILLGKSANSIISVDALDAFRAHFEKYIRLLNISMKNGDVAWRGASKLLNLSEPPENGLGYGGSSQSGSSRPDVIRDAIMRTTKEIIVLGSNDPEMISLMGLFEDQVGPDTISDYTTRVIIDQLAHLTNDFCTSEGIPVQAAGLSKLYQLPTVKNSSGIQKPLVLVPKDIVRDLPIANHWGDINSCALQNQLIRDRVNSFLGKIIKPVAADRKAALKSTVLESAEMFELLLAEVKDRAESYDPNLDAFGYYRCKQIFSNGLSDYEVNKEFNIQNNASELQSFVIETIEYFKLHVEKRNLWEELWIGDRPKRERAPQLIYYAMADCFCKAHNVDISPEVNMGGGPVDFKFSKSYSARVVVEMKRSSGTVVHGYEKQLEIYKDASETIFGIYIVMDYGDLGTKLARIQEIRKSRIAKGEEASKIIVIDSTKKISASKRK